MFKLILQNINLLVFLQTQYFVFSEFVGITSKRINRRRIFEKARTQEFGFGKDNEFLRLLRGRTSAPRLLTRAHINFTRRKTSRHKEINLRVNTRTRIVDLSASLASKLLRSLSAKDWSGQTKI